MIPKTRRRTANGARSNSASHVRISTSVHAKGTTHHCRSPHVSEGVTINGRIKVSLTIRQHERHDHHYYIFRDVSVGDIHLLVLYPCPADIIDRFRRPFDPLLDGVFKSDSRS